MTLRDITNGPEWMIWVGFAIFAILSIVLLSGHGANLIAGYNTSSKEEKARYDEKKLCRITGAGMLVIAAMIFIMGIGVDTLPASFAYVFLCVIVVDCILIIVLSNTICKKR